MFDQFLGKIITIEGNDGSGKSLISKLLNKQLKDSYLVNFPNYDNETGKIIKSILQKKVKFPGEYCFQSMQLSNKIMTLYNLCSNHDYHKYYLFCRYYESSYVYGCTSGLPIDFLIKINSVLPKSTHTFILSGKNYVDFNIYDSDYYETDEKQKIISERYLTLSKKFGWHVIDNSKSPESIVIEILNTVCNYENRMIQK